MGYAEFGGTGSVRWHVEYLKTKGSSLRKHLFPLKKLRARGVDNGRSTRTGDKLYVACTEARVIDVGDGTVVVEVTLRDKPDQVSVQWGDDVRREIRDKATTPGSGGASAPAARR